MGRLGTITAVAILASAFLASVVPLYSAPTRATLLDMVRVRGGSFLMGDTHGIGRSDERPVHSVTVSDFLLSKYEVTVGQFRLFVDETGYLTTVEREGGWLVWNGRIWERKYDASWRKPYFPQSDRNPVVMVSWDDAAEFCDWLSRREGREPFYSIADTSTGSTVAENWSADGYRLPTEAEWEYAARSGGRDIDYAWGGGNPQGNVADETLRKAFPAWPFATWPGYADGFVYTAPVGSFPPNAIGLYDMSGNAWEWCNDWYGSYAAEAQTNPTGPGDGVTHCLRGGSWTDEPAALRVSFRSGRPPNGRGVNSGFRPACPLP